MTALAALQLGLAILPLVQTGITEFVAWLASLKAVVSQTAEWTPELDAAYRAALFAKTNDPAYQPDHPTV